jgi:enoyl-CoA hydratase/carnithine racemase
MKHTGMTAWEIIDHIGILTIDNPPENYLAEPDFIAPDRFRELTADGSLLGIIITGMGRHFSAGGDLTRIRELATDESALLSKMNQGMRLLDAIESIDIPVIAAVRGACFGAGLEIALACHMRVCGNNALFAFPEINHGLVPGFGGASRLAGTIGRSAAIAMLLGGDVIDAATALEIGLADHLAPPREIIQFSMSLMKKMVDGKPRMAINSIVRAVKNARSMGPHDAMEEETRMFCQLAVASHD